ncbi:uncharacterized protein LOC128390208 [Panonychus citri]|uniref:uncharacterized protein LOC128390208 n=1 Tax=Panonychus citri TaxID=50023 RepID=UPI002307B605|nr:uncharacterized protein LOC128390208 [Panonychus citri]
MEYLVNDRCVNWIKENEFNSVAVQLDERSIGHSVDLLLSFKSRLPLVNFSLIVSDSCSIDLLSIQHLGVDKVDGLIKFGDTCLAPIPRCLDQLPVFFHFGDQIDGQLWSFTVETITKLYTENLSSHGGDDNSGKWLILYSTNYVELVKRLCLQFSWLHPGKLLNLSFNWDFDEIHQDFIHKDVNAIPHDFGAFQIARSLDYYSKIVYIGSQVNLNLRLTSGLIHIDPIKQSVEIRKGQKELSKRIGLVERLKTKKVINLGFLFTNAFPLVDDYLEKIELIKRKNHKINKIILIHSTDACKLGNFTNLDAFVLVNGCQCTKLIDKLDLHLPVLTYKEYEILCGCKVSYGGVDWNQEESTIDESADSDNELLPDSNNQLIESETLVQDKWYGLKINPAFQPLSFAKEGQSGKASGYTNEPS